MTTDDGFTADLAGIQALSSFVYDRAADLRAIGKGVMTLPCVSEDVLGAADTVTAYTAFHSAWTKELGIHAGALDEVGAKFATAASTYSQQDVTWSGDFTPFMQGTVLDS
ncbi:hypothetical protein ACIA5E_20450 [Nocardia asteroides]|uniref:hypothetical protein n=1 Tax=Nocardia asteroides TaxID=1824 RepID=UPI0037A4B099